MHFGVLKKKIDKKLLQNIFFYSFFVIVKEIKEIKH
jgi:hypothetical protein